MQGPPLRLALGCIETSTKKGGSKGEGKYQTQRLRDKSRNGGEIEKPRIETTESLSQQKGEGATLLFQERKPK